MMNKRKREYILLEVMEGAEQGMNVPRPRYEERQV